MTLEALPSPAPLEQGASYYAKIVLTGLEAALGTPDAVRGKLEDAGFAKVTVWTSAPAIFPDRDTSAGATYFARGVWGRPAAVQALPSQVVRAWVDTDTLPSARASSPAALPSPAPRPNLDPPASSSSTTDEGWMLAAAALLLLSQVHR